MGCNCKSKKSVNDSHEEDSIEELNIKGKLLKIPLAIGLTILFLCASPILLVYIWYILVGQIFTNKVITFSFLKKFKKGSDDSSDLEEINNDDYVLMDVDKVK